MVKKTFDREKFKSMIHYIIKETTDCETVFKTHLYKISYFSEFNYYEKYNSLITGESYSKIERGPAPRHFEDVVKELENEGKIKIIEYDFFNGRKGYKYINLKKPQYNLNSEEIEEIENSINLISSMSSSQVSEYSHGDTPWRLGEMYQDLDPELVFYRTPLYSVTEEDEDKRDY